MPAPVITAPDPSVRVLSTGSAFSLQLAASNTPTSWALTNAPAGLTISSAGLISGTISPTAADTAFNASITATNASGPSAAVTLKLWILAAAAGAASASDLACFANWNLDTNQLAIPGVGDPQPASAPPTFGRPAPLAAWLLGDSFPLSIQFSGGGRVLALTSFTSLTATLRAKDESPLTVSVAGTIISTGSGDNARAEIMIHLDAATTLADWIAEGENADARLLKEANTLPVHTYRDLDLVLTAVRSGDQRSSLPCPVRVYKRISTLS